MFCILYMYIVSIPYMCANYLHSENTVVSDLNKDSKLVVIFEFLKSQHRAHCFVLVWLAGKNKSYNVSSFVETKGESLIAKSAVEFVEYPLRRLSKTLLHSSHFTLIKYVQLLTARAAFK